MRAATSASSDSLPANVDAEKTILGAILLDNAAHSETAERLEADDFSLASHGRIFLRMTELMNEQHAVDTVTLAESLTQHKEIESIGGVAYLASLTEGLPMRPVIENYIRIVKEKSALRSMLTMFSMGMERARDSGAQPAEIKDWILSNLTAEVDRLDAEDWPEPEELGSELPPVLPFDPSLLPEALRPWVKDVAYRMQVPLDYPANTAIAAWPESADGAQRFSRNQTTQSGLCLPIFGALSLVRPAISRPPPSQP